MPVSKARKILFLYFGLIAICACALLLILLARTREPTFEGRPLSAWRNDYLTRKNFRWGQAVERIGTNAIPFEIQNLALNDSWWHTNYAAHYPNSRHCSKRSFPHRNQS